MPDFAKAKACATRHLLRTIEQQVPVAAPLLRGVAKFRQHEGRDTHLRREDNTETDMDGQELSIPITLNREEMRDMSVVREKVMALARQIGEEQTQRMLKVVSDAADEVGNVVQADGELTQEKFLEIFRTVEMEFDPKTLQLLPGFQFVMHPETAAKVIPKIKEWEKDPEFNAKHERIMERKREEWRDREARRKLVG